MNSPRRLALSWLVSVTTLGAILTAFIVRDGNRHMFAFSVGWTAYALFTALAFLWIAKARR